MKSEFSDMQTIIDAYTFINKRPAIHGQSEARFMARLGPGSYKVGRQFFNVEKQDTKSPRAHTVGEARMSMKHKLVDLPGYEMYNQFISNLPNDKKPFFEDLQPMTNEEYKMKSHMYEKKTLELAAQAQVYKKAMTDLRPSSKKAVEAQLSRKQSVFSKDIRNRQTTQTSARTYATLVGANVPDDVHNLNKREKVFIQQQRLTAAKRQSSFGAGTSAPNDPSHSGYFL